MPAKKPAPRAAKGKTAASRPPAKKAVVARKLPTERALAPPVEHERRPVPVPIALAAESLSTNTEEINEMRKAGPAAPEAEKKESPSAPSEILAPSRAGLAQSLSAEIGRAHV